MNDVFNIPQLGALVAQFVLILALLKIWNEVKKLIKSSLDSNSQEQLVDGCDKLTKILESMQNSVNEHTKALLEFGESVTKQVKISRELDATVMKLHEAIYELNKSMTDVKVNIEKLLSEQERTQKIIKANLEKRDKLELDKGE